MMDDGERQKPPDVGKHEGPGSWRNRVGSLFRKSSAQESSLKAQLTETIGLPDGKKLMITHPSPEQLERLKKIDKIEYVPVSFDPNSLEETYGKLGETEKRNYIYGKILWDKLDRRIKEFFGNRRLGIRGTACSVSGLVYKVSNEGIYIKDIGQILREGSDRDYKQNGIPFVPITIVDSKSPNLDLMSTFHLLQNTSTAKNLLGEESEEAKKVFPTLLVYNVDRQDHIREVAFGRNMFDLSLSDSQLRSKAILRAFVTDYVEIKDKWQTK